jgi:hypothetical protein
MIISEDKQKEFEQAAKPLIRFLCRNCHPHIAAYVDSCSAELLEGICVVKSIEHDQKDQSHDRRN